MIIVDTNVLSAMMRIERETAVRSWLDATDATLLRVTAPTLFEIHSGIARLPAGRRRRNIGQRLEVLLQAVFANLVLPLDHDSAVAAGQADATHRAAGRNVGVADSQIAGIARSLGAAIATRNLRDFAGLGIPVVNPWE